MSKKERSAEAREESGPDLVRLHLRVGWWGLLFFLTTGALLEAMHGFKLGFYLDVSNEARRLTWTLAHAHGSLLAILNLVFASTLELVPEWSSASRVAASRCLIGALILLPMGFLLGGIFVHGGDPGLGVLLVPPGAALLFVAVLLAARGAGSRGR
ncbi:MAG: hypothetical protein E4H11_05325 [Myxococcales bacterium]|nr:MAG: hypothetical protein E4H11_05325 [Myxococcales bacterium]